MAAKVRAAVRVRRNPDYVIVARTNAVRQTGVDDAISRERAYRDAGADMLFVSPRRCKNPAAEPRNIKQQRALYSVLRRGARRE